jgi:hypothetical protein
MRDRRVPGLTTGATIWRPLTRASTPVSWTSLPEPGKARISRRYKPATRAEYARPSRKTGDGGTIARLSLL